MAGRRGYTFCIVTYQDESQVKFFCKTYCKKYAYIKHDKDKADTHFHIVCSFQGNRSFNSIRALFTGEGNVFIEECHDRYASYAYLTHEGDEDKASYSEDDIVTNDRRYFTGQGQEAGIEQFIDDIMNDTPLIEMAIKYGKDYMRNYHRYQEYKQAIISEQLRIEAQNGTIQIKFMIEQEYILSHCRECPNRTTLACMGVEHCITYNK